MSAPDEIHWVRHGQLSIARHYGGIKFNGAHYTYVPQCKAHGPDCDMLIRDDVLKARKKQARAAKATQKPTETLL